MFGSTVLERIYDPKQSFLRRNYIHFLAFSLASPNHTVVKPTRSPMATRRKPEGEFGLAGSGRHLDIFNWTALCLIASAQTPKMPRTEFRKFLLKRRFLKQIS